VNEEGVSPAVYCGLAIRGGQAAADANPKSEAAMRAAQLLTIAPLALLILGCSDPTGPTLQDDLPEIRPIPAYALTVAPSSASVRVGESVRLAATISGGTTLRGGESPIAWFSSNGDVATVSATGLVQGLRAGTTLIWATYQGTRAAAHVRVFGPGKKADGAPPS
jgi:uncharacterized protein YjdB